MFRLMRREKQVLTEEENIDVLNKGTSGILAVAGDNDYPYTVPLSYAYHNNKIYFHCATTGHKLDAIARNSKVSFCVIDQDNVVPEECTTYFRSVVVFGNAQIIEDEQEKWKALMILAERYYPHHEQEHVDVINRQFNKTCVIELTIKHVTDKESMRLVKMRDNS